LARPLDKFFLLIVAVQPVLAAVIDIWREGEE